MISLRNTLRAIHVVALLIFLTACVLTTYLYSALRMNEIAAALKDYASRVSEVCPLMDHPYEKEFWRRMWVSSTSGVDGLLQVVREGPVGSSKSPNVHISWRGESPQGLSRDDVKERWSESQGNFEARFDCNVWRESVWRLEHRHGLEFWNLVRPLVFLSVLAIGLLYGLYGAVKFWSNRVIRWLIVASVFLVLLAAFLTFSVPQFITLFDECELPTLTKLTFDAYGVVWIFPLITAGLTIDALRRTVISAHYRLRAIRCLWLVVMLELVFVAAAVTSFYSAAYRCFRFHDIVSLPTELA